MPFDGTLYHDPIDHKFRRKMRWRQVPWEFWPISLLLLLVFSGVDETLWKDHGFVTRLIYGNAVAERNLIARQIMTDHPRVLRFEVAGHQYEVVTPRHPLTQEQQEAWIGYTAWMRMPRWQVDGPLAVDP